MDAKIATVNERVTSLAREVVDVKEGIKPHECLQERVLETLNKSVDGWTMWWRRMMITLISALIVLGGTAAGWWWSHSNLKQDVSELKVDVGSIETNVKEIQVSQTGIQQAIKESKASPALDSDQLKSITDAVRSAVKEERRATSTLSARPHN